ncbi:MAG: hypothetical protein QN122_03025 [Armatimonadota bacterium]|nr:hypothetical protein [Armatimonadota bacterium]MDR7447769.1 hypothetical protein [Armatimonadota bacterium]MDR7458547.1 hypothetical protein [Armatimonadota bacterium]MDR7479897.1 hypothetical protein [Armatimonadota bacterium]MDR7487755.1 hypothetical protein [Armatimonadota bacterium]
MASGCLRPRGHPREFLAIGRWESLEELQILMGNPAVDERIASMFDGAPQVTIWAEAGWKGY